MRREAPTGVILRISVVIRRRHEPMMLVRRAIALAIMILVSFSCSPPPPSPNVIMVSIDTLRADHMSLYGYGRKTTPNLEALAADSVVFDAFFNSGGATLVSHASLFTSLYPKAHAVNKTTPLNPADETLAERLASHGYETAAFIDVDWLTRKFGFAQGFETFDQAGGHLARILPKATRWLRNRSEAPFFLFVHLFDIHSSIRRLPYESPGNFNNFYTRDYQGSFDGCLYGRCASNLLLEINQRVQAGEIELGDALGPAELKYVIGLYDGGVRYVDAKLGQWLAELKREGLYDDALIVVLADHGEELGDHGLMLHGTPFEEFVRIPLLMKLPGSQHGGRRVNELASMVDVLPTILDLLGIESPERAQGRSLLSLVEEGESVRTHLPIAGGIRDARWKLFSSSPTLFDLMADPEERENVYDRHPEIVAELGAALHEFDADSLATRQRSLGEAVPKAVTLSAEESQRLESLGYVE